MFRRQKQEKKVNGLAVNGIKGNTFFTASKSNHELLQPRNFSMGNGNAITNTCGTKFFSLLQNFYDHGGIQFQSSLNYCVDQLLQSFRFILSHQVVINKSTTTNLIQLHFAHLKLHSPVFYN